ncbi:unnamed protein product [Clavelina lepadiformis]|uniref:Nicotinamide-nucleotide adenylyltransferase n=1 Tax=Clavelina lepadiformis TaxID=159417 RepID=A0ABP0GL92_CLALP
MSCCRLSSQLVTLSEYQHLFNYLSKRYRSRNFYAPQQIFQSRITEQKSVMSICKDRNMNVVNDINFSNINHNQNEKQDVYLVACGSFNPITFKHLRMFEVVRDFLHAHYSQISVKGGFLSPVSDGYGKAELVDGAHRRAMCLAATANSSWIQVLTWESEKETWTSTVDVLAHYEKLLNENRDRPARIMLLCGADILQSFVIKDLWLENDIRKIVQKHGLVVVSRPSYDPHVVIENSGLLSDLKDDILVVSELVEDNISSTIIRAAIRQKQSVKYLIPDSVIDYIFEHNLYFVRPPTLVKELAPFEIHRKLQT